MAFIKMNRVEKHELLSMEERKSVAKALEKTGKRSVADLTDAERRDLQQKFDN